MANSLPEQKGGSSMKEIWKPVVGYEKSYEVSNHGRVRSLDRTIMKKNGVNLHLKEKILKPYDNGKSYLLVDLHSNGKKNTQKVHRLVAQAFHPNPLNLPVVNHRDGNKDNNTANNLEWCTIKQNNIHAFNTGLNRNKNGGDYIHSKFTWEQAREIRKLYKPRHKEYSARALARKYNVNKSTVLDIIHNRTYKE